MNAPFELPPGQVETRDFPRFGLTPFAPRFPSELGAVRIRIGGEVAAPLEISQELGPLDYVTQRSDFHCVTTWTCKGIEWSGVRFADFFRELVQPLARPDASATTVVLRAQDGARVIMLLEDLMAPDVLLADRMNGEPLSIAHGAPLRLIAPAHYGYKNIKHLNRIDFFRSDADYRPFGWRFMEHPRARVAREERGRWFPGWLLRYLYRPLINPTVKRFDKALKAHLEAPGAKTR